MGERVNGSLVSDTAKSSWKGGGGGGGGGVERERVRE